MSNLVSRRTVLKSLGYAGAGALIGSRPALGREVVIADRPTEIQITEITKFTVRVSVVPIENGRPVSIPDDGSLAEKTRPAPVARIATLSGVQTIRCGDLLVRVSPEPLTIAIEGKDGRQVQQLRIDQKTGSMTFRLGDKPVLGLGEGGPQFDRRGANDPMRSGQGGYRLRTHGGRVPIQWLVGTEGWAMFVNQPHGAFDLSGTEGRFTPATAAGVRPFRSQPDPRSEASGGPDAKGESLCLDVFIVASDDPIQVMAEYAGLTGASEMPPLWSLGYQQSHRTLAGREEVLSVARTFREKKLPCDALIYLGTGFTPSGWNTANGSFVFNHSVFSDPKEVIDQLHGLNFHVVLHAVILARSLRGSVRDHCDLARYDEEEAGCYWNAHRKAFSLGVDGWWPDEGDPLDAASRLARNRLYYEGPQLDRPNQRPYALHRNGHAGLQRYAAFLWSGDVYSTWETLRTHVSIGINSGLSGIPYWGTDIGGFVPTAEYTGELHVRWFQFGAFCPLFRAHGRDWHLRLPWGWNTGELGPNEISNYSGGAANPDPTELHNPDVEPICRKYLELRYRLMPYLYSAVREGYETGLPIIRALWLHYPDDPAAVARGDQYLWARDILVAPVTEKGAKSRRVYLPRGVWYDFWTDERVEGGREIERAVDLATMPLFVRCGSIIPMGPLRQYTGEKVDGALTLTVYPGADGHSTIYDDDGASFDYRKGDFTKLQCSWDDAHRVFGLRLAAGSRRLPAPGWKVNIRIAPEKIPRSVVFAGQDLQIQL